MELLNMVLENYAPKGYEAFVGKQLGDYSRALRRDPNTMMAPYLIRIKNDFPDAEMKHVGRMFAAVFSARQQAPARTHLLG